MDGRDRSHWDAVKRAFASDSQQRDLDAAQLTAEARVYMGLRMGASAPITPESELELEQRGIDQAQLHVRWRKLQARRARNP
jgi:hypothetical protein